MEITINLTNILFGVAFAAFTGVFAALAYGFAAETKNPNSDTPAPFAGAVVSLTLLVLVVLAFAWWHCETYGPSGF